MQALSETGRQRIEWKKRFRWRSHVFIACFGLWTLIVLWRLGAIMVWDRQDFLAGHEAASWRVGQVPALRGRILDRRGTVLAWSERSFALAYDVPADPTRRGDVLRVVAQSFSLSLDRLMAQAGGAVGQTVVLKPRLTAAEVQAVRRLGVPELRVVSRFTRYCSRLPTAVRRQLGTTRVYGQVEIGISGWEQQHDAQLRGQDGRYQVMVDKFGEWVPETWTELAPPRPGYDVYAPIDLAPAPDTPPPVNE